MGGGLGVRRGAMVRVRRVRVGTSAGFGVLVEKGLEVWAGWSSSGSFGCGLRPSLRMTGCFVGGDFLRRRVRMAAAVSSRRVRARRLMVWLTALWAASVVGVKRKLSW